MVSLQVILNEAVDRLRAARTDLQDLEVKSAAGGLPRSVVETISAFANADGGTLILGLSEGAGFAPVAIDAPKIAADVASACSDQMEPPIRAEIDIGVVDGLPVVVVLVDELPVARKPCFVRSKGIERGTFLRTHDGDRALTTYEVHILVSASGQPADDVAVVAGATTADLDEDLVAALVRRLRATRGELFARASDAEVLRLMRVVVESEDGSGVTVGGMLALGRYPQQFFPQLDITFVAYPTTTGEPLADGTRFTDNQSIDGPIPVMVAGALSALRRNMKRRSVVVGLGREDRWEYPEEAIREIVANALMHRDYHPLAQGTQVRVALYPDRLEVASPGGLHGPISRDDLLAEPVSSSRNALLAKLLEDVEVNGTGRTVCENRGSGLLATAAALRAAGCEPPVLTDVVREFRVVIRNHGLLDEEALEWLATLATEGLNDRQRLGLAFLRRNLTITNQQYRTLTGCDAGTATRELQGLATSGLVDKRGGRRWAVWHLSDATPPGEQPQLRFVDEVPQPARRDRRSEIRSVLALGPTSSMELSERLGITKEGVLKWLRRMEAAGEVATTAPSRTSRDNRWKLTGG